jgi:hypothetical protein
MEHPPPHTEKTDRPHGYSLIEMLIVCGMILILATIPVALLRRSREKVWEAQAIRALGVMALAYENYYAQNGHMYPNYRTDGELIRDVKYTSAEAVWDDLNAQGLLPREYSGYPHNRRDLLARGYVLSIYPVDYGSIPGGGPENTYALAMVPYKDSIAHKALAVIQGQRFFSNYPSAVPRKFGSVGIFSTTIYTLPD